MFITNIHRRKLFMAVLALLLLISLADLVLARVDGRLQEYFWGYGIVVYAGLLVLVYAVFGLPMIQVESTWDWTEIRTKMVALPGFEKRYILRRTELKAYKIKDYLFWKRLELRVKSGGVTHEMKIGISFLSSEAVKELDKTLQQLVLQDAASNALFV